MNEPLCNLQKQTFIVLSFGVTNGFRDKKNNKYVRLNRTAITEVTAVKIKHGEIVGHYHSFIAIDGYDAKNIEFDGLKPDKIRAEHLIGAPSIETVTIQLSSYVQDGILILTNVNSVLGNRFELFKEMAQSCGYAFNNLTIDFYSVLTARRLKKRVKELNIDFENASPLQIAMLLRDDTATWKEVFEEYEIFFDPESKDYYCDRDDPLSWALAFARLFIELTVEDERCDEEETEFPF